MLDKTYTFPYDNCYGDVFALVNTPSGSYVCPGWHPVPKGTTRDQIKFDKSTKIEKPKPVPVITKTKTENRSWKVESSKPGKFYDVTETNGVWGCNCPAMNFFRGDCKHIKAKKNEYLEKTLN
tara:strand:- start:658 stop:1026 length:369 start_codon:yes stop_codon:yes gene_type:complete